MVKIEFTLPNLSPLHLHFQTHLPTMVIIAWSGGVGVFSVQFSHLVMSDSLWPHEPQHARPPCPSPTPRVHPNPCPLCWWCHPTISSFVIPSPALYFLSIRVFSNESVLCIRQVTAQGCWESLFQVNQNKLPLVYRDGISLHLDLLMIITLGTKAHILDPKCQELMFLGSYVCIYLLTNFVILAISSEGIKIPHL